MQLQEADTVAGSSKFKHKQKDVNQFSKLFSEMAFWAVLK